MPDAVLAVQETQDGTGHAVRIAWEALDAGDRTGTVLVAYGDTPLLEGESLRAFAEDHVAAGRAVSILSGVVADPFGYGRVLRDDDGRGRPAIVEQKDATAEQAAVSEINSGILAFDAEFLDAALPRLSNDNAKGEYYLTDIVALAREDGLGVGAFAIDDVLQTEGANDRVQLAALAKEKNRRILDALDARRRHDHRPRHHLDRRRREARPRTSRSCPACSCSAPPSSRRTPSSARTARSRTSRSAPARASYAPTASSPSSAPAPTSVRSPTCGPAPSSAPSGKIGGFVETKNAQIGDGAKVPHLSYVGDAEIGEGTNIGAGTIFANYDGVAQAPHRDRPARPHGQQQHLRRAGDASATAPAPAPAA